MNFKTKPICLSGYREIDGKKTYYASKMEANTHRYLLWMRDRGIYTEVEYQPPAFDFTAEWIEKGHGYRKVGNRKVRAIKRGCTSYKPDFRTVDNKGVEEYWETIGRWRNDHTTRLSRMKRFHPEVQLNVIDSKRYRELTRQCKNLIPGWE